MTPRKDGGFLKLENDMAKLEIEIKSELSHIEMNTVVETIVNGKSTTVKTWMCNMTLEQFEKVMHVLNNENPK